MFGVHAGLPEQINYLIDEAVSGGKCANGVISLVHHFLENYGIGEKHLQLSADNRSGQKSQNCMLQYLCWKTMIGLSDCLPPFHAGWPHKKFCQIGALVFFKRFLDEHSACLCTILEMQWLNRQLRKSIVHNLLIPTYNWTEYYFTGVFRTFVGIKSYQQLCNIKNMQALTCRNSSY